MREGHTYWPMARSKVHGGGIANDMELVRVVLVTKVVGLTPIIETQT